MLSTQVALSVRALRVALEIARDIAAAKDAQHARTLRRVLGETDDFRLGLSHRPRLGAAVPWLVDVLGEVVGEPLSGSPRLALEVDLLAFKRTREWERRSEVEPPPRTLVVMRPLALAALLALALAGALPGCSTSPAEQDAIRKTWAERDAERAAECQRRGVGFVAGGCATGGP